MNTLKQSHEFIFILISGFLILGLALEKLTIFYVPLALGLLGILWPKSIHPLYRLWMKMAHLLSVVVNSIILSLVFIFIVTPISMFKKTGLRKDFGLSSESFGVRSNFKERNHNFSAEDFTQPF